jgi:microcystin-dependent protein
MALNFPISPTVGQQYGNFVWNGSTWVPAQTLPGGLPAGSIIQWGGATAPANWLLCDGSAVSRTTYASLFSAIGSTYGSGDGSTTFNLPDLRGRVPVGRNGGSFGSLGSTGGVESVTLTAAQSGLPAHNHTQNSHTHIQDAHGHAWTGQNSSLNNNGQAGNYPFKIAQDLQTQWTGTTGNISTTVATNQATTATNNPNTAADATASHTNVQPYQVVNYIIKATAASTPGDSELATRVQPVTLGGTGATSFSSGSYLKGSGTSAVTTQAGVPASDLTGTIDVARLPTIPVANMPSGTILQVQTYTRTTIWSAVFGAGGTASAGVDVSITPRSASSKIFVIATLNTDAVDFGRPGAVLVANGSKINVGDASSSRNRSMGAAALAPTATSTITLQCVHSPATTSAVTYGIWPINYHTGNSTMVVNYRSNEADNVASPRMASTITVMEIQG